MLSLQKSNQLKSIAILMMLCLHLFNRDYQGLFQPLLFIGHQPLSYYISLFCDACVPIFAFVSGYGLYFKYTQDKDSYSQGNAERLKKLYVNYWIVLLLFAVLLGLLISKEGYPGTWQKFLLNFTGLHTSYNGAWWFFTTYVLFVLTSSFWFRLLDKLNPYIFVFSLLLTYFVAFYFRVYKTGLFENDILQWLHTQTALYFCTLFQFMLGAFALKYRWHIKVNNRMSRLSNKNWVVIMGVILLIIIHGIVPNFIVAPFTGLGFIFLFLQLDIGKVGDKVLDFFAPHATNMWLIHMFFYMIYFKDFVYSFHYVTLIFLVLVVMCLVSSYVVNYINRSLQQIL